MAKRIGQCTYCHKSSTGDLSLEQLQAVWSAIKKMPDNFDCTIIKFNGGTGAYSFTESLDWDRVNEPTVGDSYLVSTDGTIRYSKAKGQIYHHKWMFVDADYGGFDVEQSKRRSEVVNRISVGVKNKIGFRKFWTQLLVENGESI